ncbi:energy-coupling factor transporter transmembrane component T [Sinomonas sp. JGH33]|uniref:Energy-coupling factor transporter transmembrane component T n=1 Tax=Sinomonas terricola TaxID=3110330 RepID=A0ABU5TC11_9MICC|nr:energy-coupling factor transporter transmembrane component T [Sinomonas sp. JGH33]MEA5457224.1 energy-coupling factor transporter transmembrane component T [Sinomonas sp. JGH33]
MSVDILTPDVANSVLARANPVAKLAAALCITVTLLLSVDWVSASVALACELCLVPLLGVRPGTLAKRTWPLVAAAAIAAYSTALLGVKAGPVWLQLGPAAFQIVLSEHSVLTGAAIGLRGLAIALPGVFLLFSTDPTDLADGLAQKLRLPSRFVLGALAGMRLVGLLVDEWRTLGLARRARGVGTGHSPIARFRAFLGQAFALLVLAIRRATRLAVAMEARGFGGVVDGRAAPRTWARESSFSRLDAWVLLSGVGIAALAVGAAVVLGTWNVVWG